MPAKCDKVTVLFDTNAYRNIYAQYLKNKSPIECYSVLSAIKNCEKANGFAPAISFFVLAELMKHLISENDASFQICLESMKFAIEHTDNRFIPPAEFEISKELFNTLPAIFDTYMGKFGALISELGDCSIKKIKQHSEAFKDIESWLNKLIQSFIETYRNYANSDNPINNLEWRLNIIDKNKRENFIRHIRSDNRKLDLAIGMLLAVSNYLDKDIEVSEEKFLAMANIINEERQLGFQLMLEIVNKMIGGYDLSSPNNRNDIIDFLFSFTLRSNRNRILITDDNTIHRCAKEINLERNVIRLKDYLELIGY